MSNNPEFIIKRIAEINIYKYHDILEKCKIIGSQWNTLFGIYDLLRKNIVSILNVQRCKSNFILFKLLLMYNF